MTSTPFFNSFFFAHQEASERTRNLIARDLAAILSSLPQPGLNSYLHTLDTAIHRAVEKAESLEDEAISNLLISKAMFFREVVNCLEEILERRILEVK